MLRLKYNSLVYNIFILTTSSSTGFNFYTQLRHSLFMVTQIHKIQPILKPLHLQNPLILSLTCFIRWQENHIFHINLPSKTKSKRSFHPGMVTEGIADHVTFAQIRQLEFSCHTIFDNFTRVAATFSKLNQQGYGTLG